MTTENKYPYFELLEITPDFDIDYKVYQLLKPLNEGNVVPAFNLDIEYNKWKRYFNGAEVHGPVMINQFLNKPLVIAFYSKEWQKFGLEQLSQLNSIQNEIKINGGNLLIITPDHEEDLNKIAWENNLSLNFYVDIENSLAERFGVFSETNPTWNNFSGIDNNVPLLATYVIDAQHQILYNFIEQKSVGTLKSKEVISAVYKSVTNLNKKSA